MEYDGVGGEGVEEAARCLWDKDVGQAALVMVLDLSVVVVVHIRCYF